MAPSNNGAFLLQINMPPRNPTLIRRMIKELLIMQNQIIWEGGYHRESEIYCLFQNKTERLLKMFNLPYTPEKVFQVFEYPLSPVISIENPCRVETCTHMAKLAMQSYCDAVKSGEMKSYKRYPTVWTLDEKAESVYFNILFIAETGYKEID